MIVAVCIDDRNGLLFNNRRLSRDRAQQENLLRLCGKEKLWISPFSKTLLDWASEKVIVDPDFLQKAGPGEVCFVEADALAGAADHIEGVVLYRWNRTYPSDRKLDLDLSSFHLTEQTEFPGASHEKITREIYKRSE